MNKKFISALAKLFKGNKGEEEVLESIIKNDRKTTSFRRWI